MPQMQTKIMNEGWASHWHSADHARAGSDRRRVRRVRANCTPACWLASRSAASTPICSASRSWRTSSGAGTIPTEEERVKLGRQPGQGRAKLFEVRETENDVSLLRNYLTKDLVEDLDLYLYATEDDEWVIVEKDWEKVRDGIVASMTNFGYPYITIEDGDFNRNRELLLKHHFESYELDVKYAQKTLEYVYAIWSRPVHLDTVFEERPVRMSYDGEDHDSNFVESTPGEIPF